MKLYTSIAAIILAVARDNVMALGNGQLAQVAIVVRDIETSSQRWATLFGIDPPAYIVTDPGDQVNATYRGVPTKGRAKLAFIDMGGVQLELVEPIENDTAWAEGLDEKGERVHHLAFWVEDMKVSKEQLQSQGIEMIQRGDMGEGQYAYFDGTEQLGTFIELLEQTKTPL
ncbi:MAG: VOC family protein [Armatimonadetes bacterium]|nr:VOC family protein [Armatimonadota bacterium]